MSLEGGCGAGGGGGDDACGGGEPSASVSSQIEEGSLAVEAASLFGGVAAEGCGVRQLGERASRRCCRFAVSRCSPSPDELYSSSSVLGGVARTGEGGGDGVQSCAMQHGSMHGGSRRSKSMKENAGGAGAGIEGEGERDAGGDDSREDVRDGTADDNGDSGSND